MTQSLAFLAVLAVLFLALPWLTIAFNRYCDAVNRFLVRRRRAQRARKDGTVCSAYKTPATAEASGLCACCGMSDYKHQGQQ